MGGSLKGRDEPGDPGPSAGINAKKPQLTSCAPKIRLKKRAHREHSIAIFDLPAQLLSVVRKKEL